MPEISRFFGLVIRMFFNDHDPPHFRAAYGEHEALIDINSMKVLRGELPRRALVLVLEWAVFHRDELKRNWDLTRSGKRPSPIEPLD
jgi:hypothetical protein